MSKRAFSIVEILIALFLILVVASVVIPMNIANVKQAELVARWKNVFEETKYSFELLTVQNPKLISSIASEKNADSSKVFETVKRYLNIDEKKSNEYYFKNYKYRFLNGLPVRERSKYWVKDFVVLKSGVVVGFKLNSERNVSDFDPLGILLFDVNGLQKPNKFGKDIFGVSIYPLELFPFGQGQDNSAMKANCSPVGLGTMCSKYYLIGGNF